MGLLTGTLVQNNSIPYAAGLLATGTTLAIYGQLITNASVTRPASHVIAWTKYAVSYLTTAFMMSYTAAPAKAAASIPRPSSTSNASGRASELLATLIGLIDVVAYALSCFGFPLCGSALTMVVFAAACQLFTASMRALILKRPLNKQQQQAVGVVTTGLIIRASPWKLLDGHGKGSSTSDSASLLLGVICTVTSAALYSLIGVLYEKLFALPGNHLTHVQGFLWLASMHAQHNTLQVNRRTSLVGVLAATAYQGLYTWPRRQHLVMQPWASSGLTAAQAVLLHAGFGLFFTLHSYMQGQVLACSGAMTVGIVNAMRAATVTAASAVLFCSPSAPQQCLSIASATSALIITAGVLLWVLASQPHVQTNARHERADTRGEHHKED